MKKERSTPVTAPKGSVSLIFRTDDKEALKHAVEAAGGTVTVEYATVNMLAAQVPLATLKDVLKNPHVLCTYKDRLQQLTDESTDLSQ